MPLKHPKDKPSLIEQDRQNRHRTLIHGSEVLVRVPECVCPELCVLAAVYQLPASHIVHMHSRTTTAAA